MAHNTKRARSREPVKPYSGLLSSLLLLWGSIRIFALRAQISTMDMKKNSTKFTLAPKAKLINIKP